MNILPNNPAGAKSNSNGAQPDAMEFASGLIARGHSVFALANFTLTQKPIAATLLTTHADVLHLLTSPEFATKYPAEAEVFRAVVAHFEQHSDAPTEKQIRAIVTARADAGEKTAKAAHYDLANLAAFAPLGISSEEMLEIAAILAAHIQHTETPKIRRERFLILSSQAVKEQSAPQALIEGVVYVNNNIELCGAHATYKSFQALGIAEAIAGGHDWHGFATWKTPVVYITGEGRGGASQRIRALEIRHQRPCEVQFILEAVQLHRPDEVEHLIRAVSQLPKAPGLIVVDTLARCFVGGDENSARDAGLFIAGVDRIRAATGAAVLVLHHLSKAGDSRGSTAFSGAFDTIIEAKRENTTVTLRCLKQKDAAEFEPFTLVRRVVELDETDDYGRPLTSLIFEATDAPAALPKAEETRHRVLEVLKAALEITPDGLRASDWQGKVEKEVGIKSTRFYIFRDELTADDGPVEKTGSLYKLKTPLNST